MSAVAALWRFDGRPDAADGCARMLAAQEVYGPSAGAQWSNGDVALGRRLMRLLPEDAFDRQPLIGGRGRFILVADLRLDNRGELAEALRISTASAASLCDAAILLAAVERWGEACLERLVGDYAFVLWDGEKRCLMLARDPLGQRPLHYHRGDGFFAVASMPKGLHALAEIPCRPDEQHIVEFLLKLCEAGPRSFFSGVERVEPGHLVTVRAGGHNVRQYWEPSRDPVKLRDSREYVEALRALLDEAVRCRLRGAQDVGAHLSSGLDSTAVATTAARLLGSSGHRVFAFTAVPREGYDGPIPQGSIIDEGPYAAATAAMYSNMEHVLIRSPSGAPLDVLDSSYLFHERPINDICNFGWLNSINDAARDRNLSVVLTGERGNLGLSYSGWELLPELFRNGRWLQWWLTASALVARRRLRWRGVMARTIGPWVPTRVWTWVAGDGRGDSSSFTKYSAIRPELLATRNPLKPSQRPPKEAFSLRLDVLRELDLGSFYKGTLGGWRIDLRDPTADVRLLEFCLAVPTAQFVRNGIPKALARGVLADRAPRLVVEEEERRGLQAADWHEQLTAVRGRIAMEFDRLSACPAAASILDLPRLRGMIEDWPSGDWQSDEVRISYRTALPRALAVGHFLRRVSADAPPSSLSERLSILPVKARI